MAERSLSQIIKDNPIGGGLSDFSASFSSVCANTGISCSPEAFDRLDNEDVQSLALDLLSALRKLPAAGLLRSKTGHGVIRSDILRLNSAASRESFDFGQFKPLLGAILNHTHDDQVWHYVYKVVAETTPPPRSARATELENERLRLEKEQAEARADEAEAREEQERHEKEEAIAREEQEKARADLLQQREAPTRFLDYVQSVEQHLFMTFSIEPDSSKTSASTATSVEGKFYPQHLQRWADFDADHNATFDVLAAAFGNHAYFPKLTYIESLGQDLSPRVASEPGLRPFIRTSIEKPAATVASKYLEVTGHTTFTAVKFHGNAYGMTLGRHPTLQVAGEPSEPARNRRSPFDDIGVPDRWLIATFRDEALRDKVEHILVGEIKPAHVLNGAKLNGVLSAPPGDDFFLRATRQDGASPLNRVPGEMYVAKALCQAFHYMITSGLEFGYVASGEGLVFLRVREEDPNTLYYFGTVFPVSHDSGMTTPREPRATAMAHMATLCMLSIASTRRSMRWIDASKDVLKRWPKSKVTVPSLAETPMPVPPHGKDDDQGSSSGGGHAGSSAGGGQTEPKPSIRSALKRPHSHGPGPSTSTGHHAAAAHGAGVARARFAGQFVVEPPTLPYCTQACLRSLCRGQALDKRCPNAELHQVAAGGNDRHALTAGEICKRLVSQLSDNMDKDCESYLFSGHLGRYGVLFKITVTGFGYTLVAKAVQAVHRVILQHESEIYSALDEFQGRLVPVCLGLIDLERPIPLRNCQWVSHMLLMSYAGPDIATHNTLPGVDLDSEVDRTHAELFTAGLLNYDIHKGNLAWNEEVCRVVQFDFDDACMRCSPLQVKRSLNAVDKERQCDGNDTTKRSRMAA